MDRFFETLINSTADEKMRAIQYLLCRGFLLEKKGNQWYLSDNSHEKDISDINQILQKYKIGEINKRRLVIWDNTNVDILKDLFDCEYQKSFETVSNERSWQWFRRREHGYKVSTMDLEPFVALYVKAISACGIETYFSCDGNNHRDFAIEIGMNGLPNVFWHKLIWVKILNDKFNLPWEKEYQYIGLDSNKFTYYTELNRAALYLYDNRKLFRQMKKEVMSVLTPAKERTMTYDEIKNMIEVRMDHYLKKHKF